VPGEGTGTDWVEVTAWATIALAAVTFLLAIAAAVALRSIREARKARYGQVVADVAKRWDGDPLIKSRAAADACDTPGSLANTVMAARANTANKEPYYRLLAEPGFYEDMALLLDREAIEYETLRDWIGSSIVLRYDKWKEFVESLRKLPGYSQSYVAWQELADRIRADTQPGGRSSLIVPRFRLDLPWRLYIAFGRHSK
jgi:hypothetical protein